MTGVAPTRLRMGSRSIKDALLTPNAPSYAVARWFFSDFVLRYRFRLAWLTALGFAAAALQGGVLLLLNRVVATGSLDGTTTIPVFGWSLRTGTGLLPIAILLLIALGGSALLHFIQGRQVLDLWRRYQVHTVNALLQAVEQAVTRDAVDERTLKEAPVGDTMRQSQRLGALTRLVANGIAPLLRFVAFSAVAISVNPRLTVALLLAAVPSVGLALFLFARRASRSARAVAELGRAAARDLDERLAAAADGHRLPFDDSQKESASAFLQRVDAMLQRLLRVEDAKFATSTIAIAVLASFVVLGGHDGLAGPAQWGQMMIYMLALFLAFSQLVNVASSVSSFGRFYPAAARQKAMIELLEEANSPEQFRRRLDEHGLRRREWLVEDDTAE